MSIKYVNDDMKISDKNGRKNYGNIWRTTEGATRRARFNTA